VAKLMVQNGTLRLGDTVVCGGPWPRQGHVRHDQSRLKHEEALPSTPVNVTGLDDVPNAASAFTSWTTLPRPAKSPRPGRIAAARTQRGFAAHVTLAGCDNGSKKDNSVRR